MSEENGVYLFCCIQATDDKDFGEIEFEGESRQIFTIPYKDAAMVAVEAPVKIYPPKKEYVLAHQRVISSVMEKEATVVPISFGNVFKSKEDAQVLLENLYPQLEKLFPEVRNKIEVGLKVIGKQEWLEETIQQNDAIMKKKRKTAGQSEAAGYFDRIQLGEMAQKFFTRLKQEVESDIHSPLAEHAVSAKTNETLGEKMLLNGAYLINRSEEEAFDQVVNELHDKWQDKVDFKYTGPWPAYNFINIQLKVEEPT
ncbi:GvpL/GvpF family gas vesicle protein [Halobacillus fulvus]|nr:GvpL/GvpF family gas vesicle protein [Halobacillus fulvus]